MQPTITIAEANTRVDDYITRALKVFPPQTTLKPNLVERSGECADPIDRGPKNRVVANRSYQLLGLDPKAIPAYFDTMRAWWLANNFRVLDEVPRNEFLSVENNADSFQMTLKANPAGGIFLLAGSPCVWPNGTPEPESSAAGGAPSSGDTAIASEAPAPAVARPAVDKAKPRRPRPRSSEDEAESFDQTDWTAEGLS